MFYFPLQFSIKNYKRSKKPRVIVASSKKKKKDFLLDYSSFYPEKKIRFLPTFLYHPKNYKLHVISLILGVLIKSGYRQKAFTIFFKIFGALRLKFSNVKIPSTMFSIRKIFLLLWRVRPFCQIRFTFLGRKKHKIPAPCDSQRATAIAIRWFISSVKRRNEATMVLRFLGELRDLSRGVGSTYRLRKEFYASIYDNITFVRFLLFKKN